MEEKEKEELFDRTLGMVISNLLWEEGVRLKDIPSFSAEQLWYILEHHEQSRYFRYGGIRLVSWKEYVKYARELIDRAELSSVQIEIVYQSAIVVGFVALEEIINAFFRDIYIAKRMVGLITHSDDEITALIDKMTLRHKFDRGLKDLTFHSLKEDLLNEWKVLDSARRMRVGVVHNKSEFQYFGDNKPFVQDKSTLKRLASQFLDIIPIIADYLSDLYPSEFIDVDEELKAMWQAVKSKLGCDIGQILRNRTPRNEGGIEAARAGGGGR